MTDIIDNPIVDADGTDQDPTTDLPAAEPDAVDAPTLALPGFAAPPRWGLIRTLVANELRVYARDLRLVVMLLIMPLLLLAMMGSGLAPDLEARAREVSLQVNGPRAEEAVAALEGSGFTAELSDNPQSADPPFRRSQAALTMQDGGFALEISDADVPIGPVLRSTVALALVGQTDTLENRTSVDSASAGGRVRSPYDVALPGMTMTFGFYLVAILASNLARESFWGTWSRLVATPMDTFTLLIGKLTVHAIFFVAQLWVMIGVGRILWGAGTEMQLDAIVRISAAALGAGICSVGLGLLVASWSKNIAGIGQLSSLVVFVQAALGGGMIALAYLPLWVRMVAPITPIYWAVNEVRAAMYGVSDWGTTAQRMAVLYAMGAALVAWGVRSMNWSELRYDT